MITTLKKLDTILSSLLYNMGLYYFTVKRLDTCSDI